MTGDLKKMYWCRRPANIVYMTSEPAVLNQSYEIYEKSKKFIDIISGGELAIRRSSFIPLARINAENHIASWVSTGIRSHGSRGTRSGPIQTNFTETWGGLPAQYYRVSLSVSFTLQQQRESQTQLEIARDEPTHSNPSGQWP